MTFINSFMINILELKDILKIKCIKVKGYEEKFKEIPVCNWTLSADHRITDGHQASLFLNKINYLLQRPENWI